ncbi:MAG: TonB-dependent receptor [Spirochaetia bacterium]|nr:TonB-dependent receptor [Spirochaetia bacterium]
MKNIKLAYFGAVLIAFNSIFAQSENTEKKGFTLSGIVYSAVDKKPLGYATIAIPDLKIKTRGGADGFFTIENIEEGTYTLYITSPGLKTIQTEIEITGDIKKDFYLEASRVRGSALEIKDDREIQKISRYTITASEIKNVPGAFGDSISALKSLPGVVGAMGFFGPLVIRGSDTIKNQYFIDDIPLYDAQHLVGMHSVVSSDLMDEVDLYASAHPVRFGQAIGGVISINTIDNVKELSGNAEINFLTSNFLVKSPIKIQNSESKPSAETDANTNEKSEVKPQEEKTMGYWILSGRYSYFELFLPAVLEAAFGEDVKFVPKYFDYQAKGKYYLSDKHALTLFFFGFKDGQDLAFGYKEEEKQKQIDAGMDPLAFDFTAVNDIQSHAQSIRYTYRLSDRFQNDVLFYSVLNQNDMKRDINNDLANAAFRDMSVVTKPYIFGLKNIMKLEYIENISELTFLSEINYSDVTAEGKSIVPKPNQPSNPYFGMPDFTKDLWDIVYIDQHSSNTLIGGSLENKVTLGGLKLVPGVRVDHLRRTNTTTVDPRGAISYEFETETTIAAAGGYYSAFPQGVNPFYIKMAPEVAETDTIPERAIHRAASIEQKYDLYSLKLEGFYNTFSDQIETDPHIDENGEKQLGRSVGERKNYGAEVMIKKDREENTDDFYGWVSYTYTQAKTKSNLASDTYGDRYIPYDFEMDHALKMVFGYVFGQNSIEGKFQVYGSFPYTPIIGNEAPTTLPTGDRFGPAYGEKNTARLPVFHQLDLRYTRKKYYSWGEINWYVEVLNIYNNQQVVQNWKFNEPYKKGTNPEVKATEGLALIPSFGVEVRF